MLAIQQPMPLPALPSITTRVATMDDLPFVDALQKKHSKQLGFFPRAQLEGYLKNGWMRIAEEVRGSKFVVRREANHEPRTTNHELPTPVGYIAFRDRYQKRDELGAVFQLCVEPGRQRGLIGATLLQSAFDASAYGCRLFCCWCAQDLAANRFWEAMGFVPIAFRGGSTKKSRVHIFWQKRIRSGDVQTPFWFPAKTEGGALREDRLVLPIPRGLRWDEPMPVLVDRGQSAVGGEAKRARRSRKPSLPTAQCPPPAPVRERVRFGAPGGMFPVPTTVALAKVEPAKVDETVPTVSPPRRAKVDPTLIAAARELRDRWMEHVPANEIAVAGRYDVARQIESRGTAKRIEATTVPTPLLGAA